MIIDIEQLHVQRGSFHLRVPKLQVRPGEIVGLVGPNGAGKTTLLQAIAGLTPRAGGTVSVLGMDPGRDPVGVRRRTGYASPDEPVFDLRVQELIHLVAGYYPTWDAAFAESLRDRFALDPHQRASRLSRGQGTRLRLLLALAFRPQLLLLDEPASGLDLSSRRVLMELMLEAVEGGETAILLSSHRLGDVERLSERLVVLERGSVTREGGVDELVSDDQTLEEALLTWGAA